MTPKLTNGGENLILRAMDSETITFTKIALGNGDCPANYKAMTALANQQILLGLDAYSLEDEGFIKLKAILQNSELNASFIWTEVGIFAEDPDEGSDILYAYGHYQLEQDEGQNAPALVPKAASSVVEMEIEYDIFVGEAENVSAALAESSVYTTQEQFQQHTGAQSNPHAVTKEQVGLGNVPNVSTNDQTPTWSISGTLVSLVSGEALSVALGKLAKAVSSLISHIADTTKHITAAERTAWNGKAAGSHNHSAANITSGTLSMSRGGTGMTGVETTSETWTLRNGDSGSGSVIATATAWVSKFGAVQRVCCTFSFSLRTIQKATLHTGNTNISYIFHMNALAWSMSNIITVPCDNTGGYFRIDMPTGIENCNMVEFDHTTVIG